MSESSWDKRLAAWFAKRHWRVLTERTGVLTISGIKITYNGGVFDIDPPGVFVTPFGTRGRHGVTLIEVDGDGRDVPGSAVAFGEAVLRRANAAYGTISGLPAGNGPDGNGPAETGSAECQPPEVRFVRSSDQAVSEDEAP